MTKRDKNGRFTSSKAQSKVNDKRSVKSSTLAEALGMTPPKKAITNIIAFIRDCSGSMAGRESAVQEQFNALWKSTAQAALQLGQQTKACVVDFSNGHRYATSLRDVQDYPSLGLPIMGGGTDLYATVCRVIKELRSHKSGETAFLINVLTDGEATDHGILKEFQYAIEDCNREGNWTFAFQLPRGFANSFANRTGLPRNNIREWENTDEGLRETMIFTQSAMTNYQNSVASGQLRSSSYYAPVTTDLGKISQSQVSSSLNDLSKSFKSYTVEKECSVKSFVEVKTGAPYILGSAYYLLMKKEEVQPQKQVLLQEKGKRAVWGGQEARNMIGLPLGKLAKVTPGNHSNYDIYVQSTSVNRILPRGTKVLVDMSHQQHSQPTWGTAP